ncbi:MAG: hypothetical protein IPP40_15785 [bacterium]|nr:hypothetical protein [bacterium]
MTSTYRTRAILFALLVPLVLCGQPQIEWTWTDSAPNSPLNSVVTTADSGVLVSSNSRVVKLSADGEEEWRMGGWRRSICMLNDGRYVLNRIRRCIF